MNKARLEAFSDGVIAIIITIMVLELKIPHDAQLDSLTPLWPIFLSYILSFVYVGIYWNNHHHLFQIVKKVNGATLWANTHLLFWLSLLPFVTTWSGETRFAPIPVACYGAVLFMSAIAYYILVRTLQSVGRSNDDLKRVFGKDFKGRISAALYAVAIPLTFLNSAIALTFYAGVAMIWLIPDKRVEAHVVQKSEI